MRAQEWINERRMLNELMRETREIQLILAESKA
jgi:hypothetical protein